MYVYKHCIHDVEDFIKELYNGERRGDLPQSTENGNSNDILYIYRHCNGADQEIMIVCMGQSAQACTYMIQSCI